jgi:uncharacterized protein (TIGR00369 family)
MNWSPAPIRDFEQLIRVPNMETHHCFGCSPINPSGLQLRFYSDGERVVTAKTFPPHLVGWSDLVHGGVLVTMLDEVMAWTGIYLERKYILTRRMNVEFERPVHENETVQAHGRITSREKTDSGDVYKVRVEAVILNARGEVCCQGECELRLFSPEEMRELGLIEEGYLNDFEERVLAFQER